MKQFEHKTVVVTGAASGMGRSAALAFAREGAAVVACDLLEEEAGTLLADLDAAGGPGARFVRLDVACEGDWEALAHTLRAQGGLDVLFNNAGISGTFEPDLTSTQAWERLMDVNAKGVFLGMKHCRAMLAEAAPSAIVNISSTAGIIAHGDPSYTASKWAVRGLTKSAALEFSADRIRVNSVHPAMIATPLTFAAPRGHMEANRAVIPMGREASPDEIANIVLFLASDDASFMTGSEVTADGGLTTGGVAHARKRVQTDIQRR